METRLTDSLTRADGSSAYSDYNKDTDYTDDMDKWGIIYQNPSPEQK